MNKLVAFLIAMAITLPVGKLAGQCYFGDEIQKYNLTSTISEIFKVPLLRAEQTVKLAYEFAHPTSFPTPVDVLSVIAVESSFREDSIYKQSPNIGLMQINVAAHGKAASTIPRANIAFGTKLLKSYRDSSTSDSRALTAYNAGPGKVSGICKQYKTCNSEYFLKVQKAKKQILAYNANKG